MTRSDIILEFIKNNPGCTSENIVEGVKDQMSRKVVFDELAFLVKSKMILNKSLNRRDNRYYISEDNYFIRILNQLKEFENYYFILFEKMIKVIKERSKLAFENFKKRTSENKQIIFSVSYEELYYKTIHIFNLAIQKFLFILSTEFPNISSDKANIDKISLDILSKIFSLYKKISEKLNSINIIKYLDINTKVIKNNQDLLRKHFEEQHNIKEFIYDSDCETVYNFFEIYPEFSRVIGSIQK